METLHIRKAVHVPRRRFLEGSSLLIEITTCAGLAIWSLDVGIWYEQPLKIKGKDGIITKIYASFGVVETRLLLDFWLRDDPFLRKVGILMIIINKGCKHWTFWVRLACWIYAQQTWTQGGFLDCHKNWVGNFFFEAEKIWAPSWGRNGIGGVRVRPSDYSGRHPEHILFR